VLLHKFSGCPTPACFGFYPSLSVTYGRTFSPCDKYCSSNIRSWAPESRRLTTAERVVFSLSLNFKYIKTCNILFANCHKSTEGNLLVVVWLGRVVSGRCWNSFNTSCVLVPGRKLTISLQQEIVNWRGPVPEVFFFSWYPCFSSTSFSLLANRTNRDFPSDRIPILSLNSLPPHRPRVFRVPSKRRTMFLHDTLPSGIVSLCGSTTSPAALWTRRRWLWQLANAGSPARWWRFGFVAASVLLPPSLPCRKIWGGHERALQR